MVTMPLAFLIGLPIVLMVRRGGWPAFPIVAAVVFGLVLASTDPGRAAADQINSLSKAFFAYVAQAGH